MINVSDSVIGDCSCTIYRQHGKNAEKISINIDYIPVVTPNIDCAGEFTVNLSCAVKLFDHNNNSLLDMNAKRSTIVFFDKFVENYLPNAEFVDRFLMVSMPTELSKGIRETVSRLSIMYGYPQVVTPFHDFNGYYNTILENSRAALLFGGFA